MGDGARMKWEGGGTCSWSAKYSLEVFRITIRIIFLFQIQLLLYQTACIVGVANVFNCQWVDGCQYSMGAYFSIGPVHITEIGRA